MKTLISAQAAGGSSSAVPVLPSDVVYVQAFSASTSSANVLIEASMDGANFVTVGTIVNPSSVGEIWSGPGAGFLRTTVGSYVSGTITVKATATRGNDTVL